MFEVVGAGAEQVEQGGLPLLRETGDHPSFDRDDGPVGGATGTISGPDFVALQVRTLTASDPDG